MAAEGNVITWASLEPRLSEAVLNSLKENRFVKPTKVQVSGGFKSDLVKTIALR